VITGPSRTRGCSVPFVCAELFPVVSLDPLDPSLFNETFARSSAGNATVTVLPALIPGLG